MVGITGPYNKVAKYGQITKKMTEILIQEISIKEQKSMDENLRSRFVGEWLQNENVIINTNFVERGRRMGLEITNPRRVIIISVFDNGTGSDSLDEMRKVERVEERVKNVIRRLDPDSIYMKSSSNLVFAITNRKDSEIGKIGEMLRSTVEEQPDMKVVIGIDDKCRPYTMMHISYSKAYKALQSCLRTRERESVFIVILIWKSLRMRSRICPRRICFRNYFLDMKGKNWRKQSDCWRHYMIWKGRSRPLQKNFICIRTPFNINYEESMKEQAMILALFVGLHYSILPLIFIEKSEI